MFYKRENVALDAIALAGAAAQTINGNDRGSSNGVGIKIVVDITVISGTTPSLVVTLEGKCPVSGKYYTILASAALNAVGTTVLTVFPGLTAVANVKADDFLPSIWRVKGTVAGTGVNLNATVSAVLIG
jgi:hypothetical protein